MVYINPKKVYGVYSKVVLPAIRGKNSSVKVADSFEKLVPKEEQNRITGAIQNCVKSSKALIKKTETDGQSSREVKKLINQYVKNHRGKKGVNPADLDKMLSESATQRNGIVEVSFRGRSDMPDGRVKRYKLSDGTKYVLESHTTDTGDIITRLYQETETIADAMGHYKSKRFYLCDDGKFKADKYMAKESHLRTGESGLDWINNRG